MTQEIKVLENQYHVAREAWLEAVRMHNEILAQYTAIKQVRDRIKVMHTSLAENGYLAQSEELEPIHSSFEQAFARVAEAFRKADAECQVATKNAEECKTQLEAARKAVGHSG